MNAGPDVERLIAGWLVEEAPGRAPDRVLDAAGLAIDRTNQRRFVAEWREPMYVTMRGLLAAALIAAVAIGGAFFLFRPGQTGQVNPSNNPEPSASAAPSATPDATAQLAAYRQARDAICEEFWTVRNAFEATVAGVKWYDPTVSAADRAPAIDALEQYGVENRAVVDQIAALDAPEAVAADAAVAAARGRDTSALIQQVVDLLRAGDLVGAEAVDNATAPLSAGIEDFERQYALRPCP